MLDSFRTLNCDLGSLHIEMHCLSPHRAQRPIYSIQRWAAIVTREHKAVNTNSLHLHHCISQGDFKTSILMHHSAAQKKHIYCITLAGDWVLLSLSLPWLMNRSECNQAVCWTALYRALQSHKLLHLNQKGVENQVSLFNISSPTSPLIKQQICRL